MRFNLINYFKLVECKEFDFLVMEGEISDCVISFLAFLKSGFSFKFDMLKVDVIRVLEE